MVVNLYSKNILDNSLSEEYANPYLITFFNDSLFGNSNFNFKLYNIYITEISQEIIVATNNNVKFLVSKYAIASSITKKA